jgi:anti-sigma factor RsiW
VTDPATCPAFEPDLSALLDGEPAREAELRAHVAGCAPCADRLARLSRVDEALSALPDAETPGDLAERLRMRLEEERRRASDRGRSSDSTYGRAAGRDAPARSPDRPGRPAQAPRPPTSQRPPARRRRWIPLAAIAVAAAAALVVYSVLEPGWRRALEESRTAQREREPEVAVREVPAPLPDELVSGPELEAIEEASDDDLALALDLDTLADLDVIERLDVLEQLAALDGAG